MKGRVRPKRILAFLGLTFGLTWGLELAIARTVGQAAYLETGLHPLGMFFPAMSALLLQTFAYRDSSLHISRHRGPTRWLVYGYLLVTLLQAVVTALALTAAVRPVILQGVSALVVTLWTLSLFTIHGQAGAEGFRRIGLQLGDTTVAVRCIAGVALFLLSQAALNAALGLGSFPGTQERVGSLPVPEGWYLPAVAAFLLVSVVGTPLASLAVLFGEEYGWRGYLQSELAPMGLRRAAALTGLIWGIWHAPIVLSGVHTYPPNALGMGLALAFFTLAGCALSYAVLKARSVWVACVMHGVLNSVYPFTLTYLMRPDDRVLSFGLGIYGLLCLAAAVAWLLRDPVWDGQPGAEEGAP